MYVYCIAICCPKMCYFNSSNTLQLLVDGQTQPSSCNDIQLQVEIATRRKIHMLHYQYPNI